MYPRLLVPSPLGVDSGATMFRLRPGATIAGWFSPNRTESRSNVVPMETRGSLPSLDVDARGCSSTLLTTASAIVESGEQYKVGTLVTTLRFRQIYGWTVIDQGTLTALIRCAIIMKPKEISNFHQLWPSSVTSRRTRGSPD